MDSTWLSENSIDISFQGDGVFEDSLLENSLEYAMGHESSRHTSPPSPVPTPSKASVDSILKSRSPNASVNCSSSSHSTSLSEFTFPCPNVFSSPYGELMCSFVGNEDSMSEHVRVCNRIHQWFRQLNDENASLRKQFTTLIESNSTLATSNIKLMDANLVLLKSNANLSLEIWRLSDEVQTFTSVPPTKLTTDNVGLQEQTMPNHDSDILISDWIRDL